MNRRRSRLDSLLIKQSQRTQKTSTTAISNYKQTALSVHQCHLLRPSTISTSPPKRRRKVTYAKAFDYLLDPNVIYEQAIMDSTVIEGQFGDFGRVSAAYRNRLVTHCGIKYDDIITIHNPEPDMVPALWRRPTCQSDPKFLTRILWKRQRNFWGQRKNQSSTILPGNKSMDMYVR